MVLCAILEAVFQMNVVASNKMDFFFLEIVQFYVEMYLRHETLSFFTICSNFKNKQGVCLIKCRDNFCTSQVRFTKL
jgi:hypothetical protein